MFLDGLIGTGASPPQIFCTPGTLQRRDRFLRYHGGLFVGSLDFANLLNCSCSDTPYWKHFKGIGFEVASLQSMGCIDAFAPEVFSTAVKKTRSIADLLNGATDCVTNADSNSPELERRYLHHEG